MNERIFELAKQADLIQWDTLSSGARTPDHASVVKARKFAELIVQECVAQCEQVATDADAMTKSKFVTDAGRQLHEGMWGGAKNCAAGIKEHFGVEE
jgi:hypothetical protein